MSEYLYHLAKGKKLVCPQCGKKTFVPFVDDFGNLQDITKYGRCDRENSCNYFCYPTPNKSEIITLVKPITKPKEIIYRTIATEDVQEITRSESIVKSNLFQYLKQFTKESYLLASFKAYNVGCFDGYTAFCLTDMNNITTDVHLIKYDKQGHRDKRDFSQSYLGAILKKDLPKIEKDRTDFKKCLFGLHLANRAKNKDKIICIVESEKTALICQVFDHLLNPTDLNKFLFLGAGGCNGLDTEGDKLLPIKDRKIILIPDNDKAGNKWKEKAEYYKQKGFNLDCITFENHLTEGEDLADHITQRLQEINNIF